MNRFIERIFKKDVLILVNKKNRDLLGLIYLDFILRRKYGLKSSVKSAIGLRSFWIKLFRPQVVLYVQIDCIGAQKVYANLGKMGISRLMVPTETALNPTETKEDEDKWKYIFAKYRYDPYVEGVLVAGRAYSQLVQKFQEIDKSKIFVCGNPSFDWLKYPLKERYLMKREMFLKARAIPKSRKLILLATSYAWADRKVQLKEDEKGENFLQPFPEACQMIRQKTVESFNRFLSNHKDWVLLVKCHPFEKKDFYEKVWQGNPQIIQVHEEEIINLLALSDVLVHWNSTTAVQAWILNKPTIILDFPESKVFFPGKKPTLMQNGSYKADSPARLEELLEHVLSKKKLPADIRHSQKKYLSQWFNKVDGKSVLRMAKVVNRFYEQNQNNHINGGLTLGDLGWLGPRIFRYYFYFLFDKYFNFIVMTHKPLKKRISKEFDDFLVEKKQPQVSKLLSYFMDL